MESGQAPQLKGVVIITLPPSDNPSLGKTITAFTLSDSPPTPPQQPHQAPQEQLQLPTRSSPNRERQFSLVSRLFGSPRTVLGLLGISVVALFLWASVSPETLFELRSSSDDDRKPSSFIFPLYPKLGDREISQRDVELKLGRFVGIDSENVVASLDDRMRHKKITKLVSTASGIDSTTISPVKGNIYPDGLYFTYMFVGNPPRHYFLDMDTGSDLTWIQCDAPCTSCAKGANPLYKPTKGKIIPSRDSLCVEVQRNQNIGYCETCQQCDYEIEYADHSSSVGVLAKDELHLMFANGSRIKKNIVFGCAYDQQGLLLNSLTKTDGILGLNRAKVSLPSQLASQGIINNVVGHCLTIDAGGGGYMFLGNDFVPYWQMAWVPMLNSPSTNFYQSEVVKMSYGNKQLSLGSLGDGPGPVVFDSGSSYTYFTKQAYSDLVASLEDVSGKGLVRDASDPTLPICWQAKFPIRSVVDVKQFFKPLTLQFGSRWRIVSTKLRIPPEGYLIISNKGNVCLGILDGSKVHDGSTIILGDVSLRGQLVVYDNVNQKIGWAQSDCVKPPKVKSDPFFGGMDLPN
uniref:Putative aspartic proteinase Asp1 n=1 Tax=Davidia involucrata TaxID=16924 RepID=A0A5B6Z5Z1_DAVIN